MGQAETKEDSEFEQPSTREINDSKSGKKRARSPDCNDGDATRDDRKRANLDNAIEVDGAPRVPRKSSRQIILERTAKWIAKSPTCYSESFVFFYSANTSRGYNSENAWLAQAYWAATRIDGVDYRSAYHYYYLERAGIVKRFNLKRKHKLTGKFKGQGVDAENLAVAVKGYEMDAKDMKDLVYDFEWTDEALEAWDKEALFVLYKANFYKFTRHQNHHDRLIGTGTKYIVKACPQECTCTCGTSFGFLISLEHRHEWRENLLGKTLMRLRDDLKNVASPIWTRHPTEEQLNAVPSIRDIDDGRTHVCELCRNHRQEWI